MLKYLLLTLTLISFAAPSMALEEGVDTISLDTMKISKEDIMASLDKLRKGGQISEEDYQKAKKQLEGLSDAQIKGIKDKAVKIVKENPEVVNEAMKSKQMTPEEIKKSLEKKKTK